MLVPHQVRPHDINRLATMPTTRNMPLDTKPERLLTHQPWPCCIPWSRIQGLQEPSMVPEGDMSNTTTRKVCRTPGGKLSWDGRPTSGVCLLARRRRVQVRPFSCNVETDDDDEFDYQEFMIEHFKKLFLPSERCCPGLRIYNN